MLHKKYPYPDTLRRIMIFLFASGMAAMAFGIMIIAIHELGADFTSTEMKEWLVPSFMISFLALGGLFLIIATGLYVVNEGRDGRREKFITPHKGQISESESPFEYRFFACFFVALGSGFIYISILLLSL